jgi:hypothetical protein
MDILRGAGGRAAHDLSAVESKRVASRVMVYEKAARGASGVAQRAAGVPLAAIAGLRRRFGLRDLEPNRRRR